MCGWVERKKGGLDIGLKERVPGLAGGTVFRGGFRVRPLVVSRVFVRRGPGLCLVMVRSFVVAA